MKITPLDPASLKPITDQHPDAEIVEDADAGIYAVVRPAAKAEWATYRSDVVEAPALTFRAKEKVCVAATLYPPKEELSALFTRLPGAVEVLFGHIAEITGITGNAKRRKP